MKSDCPEQPVNPQTGRPVVCDIMLSHVTELFQNQNKVLEDRLARIEYKLSNGLTGKIASMEQELIHHGDKIALHHLLLMGAVGVILVGAMTWTGYAMIHAVKSDPHPIESRP